jgi:hypothetical protein
MPMAGGIGSVGNNKVLIKKYHLSSISGVTMNSMLQLRCTSLIIVILAMIITQSTVAGSMIGTKQLTYNPTSFQESSANNGTIDNTIPLGISLAEETFTGTNGEDFVATGKIVVSNVPSGLAVVALRSSASQIYVTLTGTAAAHTAANNVNNLTIAFQNGAFTGGSAMSVSNSNKGDLQITFLNPVVTLTAFTPVKNAVNIAAASNITLTFNEAMSSASMSLTGSIRVDGSVTGRHTGTVSYNSGTFTATIDPAVDFTAGEKVTVTVTTQVTNAGSFPLSSAAVWTFTVATSVTDQFVVPIRYGTGDFPIDVIATDVDGDGDNDLAVANSSSHTISVMLNTGSGTFAPKTDYASGNSPRSLSVGDLDRNGSQDIVVTNPGSNTISVLLNNGNGTFAAAVAYAAGLTADHPLIVDLNADGYLDIAATAYAENVVSIFMNNGNGTFAARVTYSSGSNTVAIASADVDGDRDLDLVIGNYEASSVSVLRNNGVGVFGTAETYAVGTNSIHNAVADVDADGDADIVVANRSSNSVTVLKNNGSGTFGSSASYATGTGPFAVAAGDVDGDGDIDLAVSSQTSNTFSILKNNGTGNFSARTDYSAPSGTLGVCIADLNQDGAMEVITTNADVDSISMQFGAMTPSVTSRVPTANGILAGRDANISFTFNTGMAPTSLVSGTTLKIIGSQSGAHTAVVSYSAATRTVTCDPAVNFSAGEMVELVLTTGVTGAVGQHLAVLNSWRFMVATAAADTFAPAVVNGSSLTSVYAIQTADLDADGDNDIAMACYGTGMVTILKNDGTGAFTVRTDYAVGIYPVSVAVADVDGDGDKDVLYTRYTSNVVGVMKNNGNGSFAASTEYSGSTTTMTVTTADVDGDGDVDILAGNFGTSTLSVMKNNGNGTFAARSDYGGGSFDNIASADMDGDGDMDVITNIRSWGIIVCLNNGQGAFTTTSNSNYGDFSTYVRGIDVADIDSDGDMDVAATANNWNVVTILRNNGNATFATPVSYNVGTNPNSVRFMDADGDGDLDLGVTNVGGNTITVLKNIGNGTYDQRTDYSTGEAPYSLQASDVDNDGRVDMLTANFNGDNISVLKNSTFAALPVELTSFTAASRGPGVELRWNTATEMNNHGFEVERKLVSGFTVQGSGTTVSNLKPETSNSDWTRIGFVEGNGNSNVSHEYSFTDRTLSAGRYAFRLKQIDRDGKFEYSKTVEVTVAAAPAKFALEQNFPNPFNPSTTIGFTLQVSGHTTLKIYDAIGREVAELANMFLEAGTYHQRTFDASRFSSGIYFARLVSDNKTQIKKMSLMK